MKRMLWAGLVGAILLATAVMAHTSLAAAKCDVTYDSFGKAFMDKYCVACHSSAKSGFARKGAPAGSDFDKVEAITKYKAKIVELTVTKAKMPPGAPKPTADETAKVKAWIECEYK
jgi:uncharacterized membrane protein